MLKVTLYDGDQIVKEFTVALSPEDVEARLTAEPYTLEFEVDGQLIQLGTLVHPSIRPQLDALLSKARRKKEEVEEMEEDYEREQNEVGEEEDEEEDRKFRELMRLLEEVEGENEEEEEEEEEEEKAWKQPEWVKTLVSAVKELKAEVRKLQVQRSSSEQPTEKAASKQPIFIKSWAPYERVPKFAQGEQSQSPEDETLTPFQKAFLQRLFGQTQ